MTYESAEVSGMPTLMRDGQPVAYLDDGKLHVSPWFAEQGFGLLTRVLAPDEATVERLMRDVARRVDDVADEDWDAWAEDEPAMREQIRKEYTALLAALADTSAQARHTTDQATGGGVHG